jgi:uncharacterized protein (DUF1499 family)
MDGAQAHLLGTGKLMVRRYVHEEPTSKLAIWARRTAGFAFAASFIAVIIVRSGMLENLPALATLGGAIAIACVAVLLSLAAFVVIWLEGLAGMGKAIAGLLISLALIAYPGYLAIRAAKLPWIYDITTDPLDPPRYEALARVRPRDANPVAYAGLYSAEQQRSAYPDIGPMLVNATPEMAYEAARNVIARRRDTPIAPLWRVIELRAPLASARREGRIEAVAYTSLMGLRDDVVVRFRAEADGTRIDARSSSRYGSFDFGANATRIRNLMNDIDLAIAAQKAVRPRGPTVKKNAPAAKKGQTSQTKQ